VDDLAAGIVALTPLFISFSTISSVKRFSTTLIASFLKERYQKLDSWLFLDSKQKTHHHSVKT
jgi:hypothetical protein